MAIAANLGFPRIGVRRELKRAVEEYWAGNIDPEELQTTAADLRRRHWQLQQSLGIEHVPSNDFSLYDHVLDTAAMVGAVPKRFAWSGGTVDLATYFAMARGTERNPAPGHDQVVRHELPLPRARVRAGHEVQAGFDQARRPVSRGVGAGHPHAAGVARAADVPAVGQVQRAEAEAARRCSTSCCPSTKKCSGGWPTPGPTGCRSTSRCWPSICPRRHWHAMESACAG